MSQIIVRISQFDGTTNNNEYDPNLTIGRLRLQLAAKVIADTSAEKAHGAEAVSPASIILPTFFSPPSKSNPDGGQLSDDLKLADCPDNPEHSGQKLIRQTTSTKTLLATTRQPMGMDLFSLIDWWCVKDLVIDEIMQCNPRFGAPSLTLQEKSAEKIKKITNELQDPILENGQVNLKMLTDALNYITNTYHKNTDIGDDNIGLITLNDSKEGDAVSRAIYSTCVQELDQIFPQLVQSILSNLNTWVDPNTPGLQEIYKQLIMDSHKSGKEAITFILLQNMPNFSDLQLDIEQVDNELALLYLKTQADDSLKMDLISNRLTSGESSDFIWLQEMRKTTDAKSWIARAIEQIVYKDAQVDEGEGGLDAQASKQKVFNQELKTAISAILSSKLTPQDLEEFKKAIRNGTYKQENSAIKLSTNNINLFKYLFIGVDKFTRIEVNKFQENGTTTLKNLLRESDDECLKDLAKGSIRDLFSGGFNLWPGQATGPTGAANSNPQHVEMMEFNKQR